MRNRLHTSVSGAVIVNALVFLIIACAFALSHLDADRYYRTVQEDELLEWATFWAFVLAASLSIQAALLEWRDRQALPWFLSGIAVFCLFVALEEISWGQRIFGYRPPVYFLDQNYQQEFNLHNVVETRLRKLALQAVILGYGVFLPLLQLAPKVGPLLDRLRVVAPPLGLVPVFLAAYALYAWYPLRHMGEWVELILGLGFLFPALLAVFNYRTTSNAGESGKPPARIYLISATAVISLGFLTTVATRHQAQTHPGNVTAVRAELRALGTDFRSGKLRHRCGLHKRLYTFVRQYGQDYLFDGTFSNLVAQGLPQERADFFLDPWNSPYWVRDSCASRSEPRTTFVYSLGPNRRRDSTRYEILDDDIGEYIRPARR